MHVCTLLSSTYDLPLGQVGAIERLPAVQIISAVPLIVKPLLQDTVYFAPLLMVESVGLTVPPVTVGLLQSEKCWVFTAH